MGSGRDKDGKLPSVGAGHEHGVELQAARAVGGEHLHGVEHGHLPRAPARARARRHRAPRGTPARRRRPARDGLGNDVGERDRRVELLPPPRLDQTCGARQLLPQDPEGVLHRHAREQRRLVQRGACAFDP